ncbi:hypothetical protein SLS58_009935 [Diplodia intermedia]|uniref:Uncharacterized protein n=1 Tax=Diplodia intermedia TaxID=856260 RepID=A0ABR3T9H6_9PEZI
MSTLAAPDAAATAAATAAASTPATSTITNPSHALLSRAHSPDTSLRIFTDRVQKKPLLLRPTEATDIPTDARSQRRTTCRRQQLRAKKSTASKPAPLSAAQKRALGIYAIPTAQRRYDIFEGLHRMWVGYMREVLGLKEEGGGVGEYVTPATVGPKLATIPKEHTVFRFEIPLGSEGGEGAKKPRNLVFELHGSQFENRAPDRANKKFKQHAMFDL